MPPENRPLIQDSARDHATRERAYWEGVSAAARRLAKSAAIAAVSPSASGGHSVYQDMAEVRAAMQAKR